MFFIGQEFCVTQCQNTPQPKTFVSFLFCPLLLSYNWQIQTLERDGIGEPGYSFALLIGPN